MNKLTFTMPSDKAAQIIIGFSGPNYIIMDRKIPGEKTIIDEDRFHEVREFDTLDEAYEFAQSYDANYCGNYLFGDLTPEEAFSVNNDVSTTDVILNEAVTIDSGVTLNEGYTATYAFLYPNGFIESADPTAVIQSFKEEDAGPCTVFINVNGDHNRLLTMMKEFEIKLDS